MKKTLVKTKLNTKNTSETLFIAGIDRLNKSLETTICFLLYKLLV